LVATICGLAVPLAAQNSPKLIQVGVVKDYAYQYKPKSNLGPNLILLDERRIYFQHASFISLDLADVSLGEGSFLEFTSVLDGDTQIMPANNIQPMTAFFNGDTLRVRLWAGPHSRNNGYRITKASVGNPAPMLPNTICGTGDNRVPSSDRGIGRIFFRRGSGTYICTGFLISTTNCFATAGHCLDAGATNVQIQFQVPSSDSSGNTRNASASNTYLWTGSRYFQNNSSGDWGVFTTRANTTTGKHAYQAQGKRFLFTGSFSGTARVTGYGTDSSPKSRNFTQQTATGGSHGIHGNTIRYWVDTEGGDSGAPVIMTNGYVAGVHTTGGCNVLPYPFSYNYGTKSSYSPFVTYRNALCNPKPDLSPTALSASTTVRAGGTVSLGSTIKNLSSGGTGGWSSQVVSGYYLSSNSTISTADVLLRSFNTVPLGPQQIHVFNTTASVPRKLPSSSSTCYIGVWADRTGTLSETSETNNTRAIRRTCVGLPDLAATGLQINATSITPLQKVTIQSKIKNIGQATSPSATSGHFLSSNSVISSADVLVASFTTPSSGINVERLATTYVTLPSKLPVSNGTCYVGVLADRLAKVSEIDEANNERAVAVQCRPLVRPDLTVTSLSSTDVTVVANQRVTLTSRIQNVGNASSPKVASRYYLSTNSTISTSDTVLASFTTAALGIGGAHTVGLSVTIPTNVKTGTCYFGAYADYSNALAELNDANNTRALKATCTARPDLVVASLANTDSVLRAGSSIAVTTKIQNNGGASSAKSTTGIFLSTNSTISTGDTFLGSLTTPSLGAGLSATTTTRHVVPYCTPTATCWLGAIADVSQIVTEANEANNTRGLQKACGRYAGSLRVIEWKPRFSAITRTAATFDASNGGSGGICITAPTLPNHWYLLAWSANPTTFQLDTFANFSLSLLNGPIFPAWFSKVNAAGQGNAAFNVPKTKLPAGFTTYTHSIWFSPAFSFAGFGSNRISTRINP